MTTTFVCAAHQVRCTVTGTSRQYTLPVRGDNSGGVGAGSPCALLLAPGGPLAAGLIVAVRTGGRLTCTVEEVTA